MEFRDWVLKGSRPVALSNSLTTRKLHAEGKKNTTYHLCLSINLLAY